MLNSPESVREQLGTLLPKWLQRPVTWITGLPLANQAPLWNRSGADSAVLAMLTLVSGTAIVSIATQHGLLFLPLAVIGVILGTGGVRWLYVGIAHHASHGNVFPKCPRTNALLGDLISLLLGSLAHAAYQREHAQDHHAWSKLGTAEDPDAKFLLASGFSPDRSRRANWLQLARVTTSPSWHLRYFINRIRSACGRSPMRWAVYMAVQFGIFMILHHEFGLAAWLVGWVMPVSIGYNISALLQFLSEHMWFCAIQDRQERRKALTVGRFLIDPIPTRRVDWIVWWTRLVLLHIPARLAILVADLSQHDLHHIKPMSKWSMAAYERRDLRNQSPEKFISYGGSVFQHIDRIFKTWES